MRKRLALLMLLILAVGVVRADTLTLLDGTVIEGRVVPQGDKYWIKLPDGQTRTYSKGEVKAYSKGTPAAPATVTPKPAAPATPATPAAPATAAATPTAGSAGFAETKSKANLVDVPLAAVGLWQSFIDNNPTSPDLAAAKAELEQWKKLDKDHAEKINGKWIGGEERKKLLQKVHDLISEAHQMEETQTLKAVAKLEEAVRIYPNNWEANFELGFLNLAKGGNAKYDQAIKSLEQAAKLRPNSAATLSDLAIAYNFRQRYEQSVLTAYKAAQIEDSKEIAQNLVNSIAQAPPGMRENNTKVRPIMEEATLLARKHGIADGRQNWIYVRPHGADKPSDSTDDQDTRPGVIGNGSGFLVSADGYILTNRHVAREKNVVFMCRFSDGTEKTADIVCIDDDDDIALLKVKGDKPLPYLKIAEAESPAPGAECSALGFPIGSVMNYSMQVTSGTVSSVNPSEPYHVTLTCKITHGNSGGPLVDKYGNVIGVVSAGLTAYTETYGKALSAGQIHKFLEKNKDKIKATFEAGKAGDKLDSEEIYKKASPATVCVILIRSGGKDKDKTGAD